MIINGGFVEMHKFFQEARTYLEALPRIYRFEDREKYDSDVFLTFVVIQIL